MYIENMEVNLFKALAHPTRLKIVKQLIEGKLCVCELNEGIELSQSNLSQHLKILKDAYILIQERDGLRINYGIKNEKIIELINIVEQIVVKEINDITKQIRS